GDDLGILSPGRDVELEASERGWTVAPVRTPGIETPGIEIAQLVGTEVLVVLDHRYPPVGASTADESAVTGTCPDVPVCRDLRKIGGQKGDHIDSCHPRFFRTLNYPSLPGNSRL